MTMTKRLDRRNAVLLAACLLVVAVAALVGIDAAAKSEPNAGAKAAARPLRLADATMIVEVNWTDRDVRAGVSSRPVKTPAYQRSSGRLAPRRVPAAARIRPWEQSAAWPGAAVTLLPSGKRGSNVLAARIHRGCRINPGRWRDAQRRAGEAREAGDASALLRGGFPGRRAAVGNHHNEMASQRICATASLAARRRP
jgi:hypothetical protein